MLTVRQVTGLSEEKISAFQRAAVLYGQNNRLCYLLCSLLSTYNNEHKISP